MKREIKYRVWFSNEKEMREVAMLRWENDKLVRVAGYWKGAKDNGWTDFDPENSNNVLMQFIGLKDDAPTEDERTNLSKEWHDHFNALIRDMTAAGSIPKSEARRRILKLSEMAAMQLKDDAVNQDK
jgi:hypothetical protein